MTKRESMLNKLSAYQFAAWDTALFLNTHPDCVEALKARRDYVAAADAARKEYNEAFGMLTQNCPEQGDRWQWICDPWPWDAD